MWRSKFQAFLSSIGCLYVLRATDNPVMVGDINVSREHLEQRHTPEEIIDARVVYGLLMVSMTGYAIADFRMQQAKSPSGAGTIELLHAENPSRNPQDEERI